MIQVPRIAIFMEYVPGGSLEQLLDKFGALSEEVTRCGKALFLCKKRRASGIIIGRSDPFCSPDYAVAPSATAYYLFRVNQTVRARDGRRARVPSRAGARRLFLHLFLHLFLLLLLAARR